MKKILGLGLVLLASAGCGDLFMKAKDVKVSAINAISCDLDTEAFSRILSHNIRGDIHCLQESIHSFIELVKTDRPGYISEKVLTNFIQKGPIDLGGNDIIPLVEGLFDLTKLILGGDRGYISKADFDRLIAFLIEFNKNIYPISEIFSNDNELNWADYDRNRKIVRRHLIIISQEVRLLLDLNRPNLDRLDLAQFLERFFKDDREMLDKLTSMLFLKRVFLGGDAFELSHLELEDLLIKLPELGEVAYDLVKIGSFGFKDNARIMINDIYLKDIATIKRNLRYGPDSYEALFTVYDLTNALSQLGLSVMDLDFTKYPREIMHVKRALLGSGGEFFSSMEMHRLLHHAEEILEEGSFFFRVYDMYADELNSRKPLTNDFSGFQTRNSREEMFLRHFSQIVNEYRFFKGAELSSYYSFQHYRNPLAVFEIGALEYLIKLVMADYGNPSPQARGGYHMTLEQTVVLIEDIKILLKDIGIITIGKSQGGEVQGVADNLVLMSTLFQYQSDGCDDYVCMEVPELNEFLMGLLTSINIKDFFTEEMLRLCAHETDEYDRIYPECFRRNFINVLNTKIPGEGKALRDYMPLLSSYLVELTQDLSPGADPTESSGYLKFITESEAFTRSCMFYDDAKTEPVPLRANDAFAVFAGMLSIESTILKFDVNENNKLDGYGSRNEVIDAFYSTYKGAIDAMVAQQGGPIMTKVSRQIFQYLIKYGKVPETDSFSSIWSFIKFLLKVDKSADADRTTIASILRILGEQNSNGNDFKCEECLRDPTVECVPVTCHRDYAGELVCVEEPWE